MTGEWLVIGANVILVVLALLLGPVVRRWQWPANFVGHLVGAAMAIVVLANCWTIFWRLR